MISKENFKVMRTKNSLRGKVLTAAMFALCPALSVTIYALCQGGIASWAAHSDQVTGSCSGHTIIYRWGWNPNWVDGGSSTLGKVTGIASCNNQYAPSDVCVPTYVLISSTSALLGGIRSNARVESHNGTETYDPPNSRCIVLTTVNDFKETSKDCHNPPICSSPREINPVNGQCECPSDRPVCVGGTSWNNTTCSCQASPILIDVLGDGFNLTDGAGGVAFDLNSDVTRSVFT